MLLLNNITHVVSCSHAAAEQYNSRYVLHTCRYLFKDTTTVDASECAIIGVALTRQ